MNDAPSVPDIRTYLIDADHDGKRVDKGLSDLVPDLSRARIQALLAAGQIMINGRVCESASCRLKTGDHVALTIPAAVAAQPKPENIPLDIVFEDRDLLVLNKPAGLVVHPGAGNYAGTLVNALLYHCGAELSGIGGVLRPGIVHRLDKDTSGLMVAAKSDRAHQGLAAQLEDRSLSRLYHALVLKVPVPVKGMIDQPVGRDPASRLKMSIQRRNGRVAVTHYQVLERFDDACALVACRLETGRTHQIRVHMQFLKHPLIGDPLYGPQPTALRAALKKAGYSSDVQEALLHFPRQALHAKAMAFIHPVTGEAMSFETALPEDMSNLLKMLEK